MDSLLKSALEGLDNEESISIAPKRKIALVARPSTARIEEFNALVKVIKA